MSKVNVAAEAVIPAAPEKVYGILADYRSQHPKILPQRYFSDLEVEQGGVGAGTVIRFKMKVLGSQRVYHQRVEEPEPGRVLVEKDLDSDVTTTFTVTPASGGGQAHLRIETAWTPKPGLQGKIEKALTTSFLRSVYAEELKQLADYARAA